ncbi:hypothetical protein [Nostoc sp. CMAA1605]|uniref:hypothetical protein n=1 Tax=Nostoc sp. CMAA1605 TaxID=2055159 RepID=UPI001F2CA5E2|nr:hypothetical protein [Nostoc sp. CMAA1605]
MCGINYFEGVEAENWELGIGNWESEKSFPMPHAPCPIPNNRCPFFADFPVIPKATN